MCVWMCIYMCVFLYAYGNTSWHQVIFLIVLHFYWGRVSLNSESVNSGWHNYPLWCEDSLSSCLKSWDYKQHFFLKWVSGIQSLVLMLAKHKLCPWSHPCSLSFLFYFMKSSSSCGNPYTSSLNHTQYVFSWMPSLWLYWLERGVPKMKSQAVCPCQLLFLLVGGPRWK